MTAYNAATFIGPAIESVLAQSFSDFEFLIVDDGSRDATPEIIASCADPRIRILTNTENIGLIRSLNLGLDHARGEFVARMDADDVSLPKRFEEQVRFLDAHPRIGLCGTAVETFGARTEYWCGETDPARLKCLLLFEANINHPTVMFRRTLIERHRIRYDPRYPHAEDYAAWACLGDVSELANIAVAHVRYRLHDSSVSHANRDAQNASADKVRRGQLAKLGIDASDRQLHVHSTLARGAPHTLGIEIDEGESWLLDLLQANRVSGYCDRAALSAVLYEKWFKLCRAHRARQPAASGRFLASPLAQGRPLPGRLVDAGRLLLGLG